MIILSGISMDPYFSEVSLRIVRVASCQDVTSRAEVLLYTLHINQYCILLLLALTLPNGRDTISHTF